MTNKEDAKNLGYLEVNLFDEMDQGSLSEYMDMEPTVNMDESQDLEALTNRLEAMGICKPGTYKVQSETHGKRVHSERRLG
ncbi:hypothetical protein NDA17_000462 [Ustilago hordei]|nr:hypothetical protein NDA17_000462 [Ustilago hordei]